MSDAEFPSFRTKTGVCTITPDHIVINREGLRGKAAQALMGSGSIFRYLLLLTLMAAIFFVLAGYLIWAGVWVIAIIPIAGGCSLLVIVFRSRNNSLAPVIERSKIISISATPPLQGFTRAYFTIVFESDGSKLNRLIPLPGILQGGAAEFERAKELFRTAGLEVEER